MCNLVAEAMPPTHVISGDRFNQALCFLVMSISLDAWRKPQLSLASPPLHSQRAWMCFDCS
jgi:hypothetical protein